MPVVDGVVLPEPMVEYRAQRLTRSGGLRAIEALDDAGLNCSLSVEVGPQEARVYCIRVPLDGLSGENVTRAIRLITEAAGDATVEVVGSYLAAE